MPLVASFHLARFPAHRVPRVMAGAVLDRRALARTPGLRFARQLGTGRGREMGIGADWRRWALFAVWEREGDLDAFLTRSPLAARWHAHPEQAYAVRLAPLAAHGTWGGSDPLAGFEPAPDDDAAPVAVLTRATIPLRHWPAFHRAVPPVGHALDRAEGLLAATGIGERPLGTLATFSLWRSAADVDRFAHGPASPHRPVVAATRRHGWFRDELFARFRPYAEEGTWPGAPADGGVAIAATAPGSRPGTPPRGHAAGSAPRSGA